MNREPAEPNADVATPSSPQSRVAEQVAAARALQRLGTDESIIAIATLEKAMAEARSTPFEIEFQTRVELALTLGDLYVSGNDIENARRILSEEANFAETIFQVMQTTGKQEQRRAAAGGRVQLRDRARQVSLIGEPAPEITIRDWIIGEPVTLSDLRGRVVLLEFWATWCKPCQQMFPKLKELDLQYRARGFDVIALTRHYFANRDVASSEAEELDLMRSVVRDHELDFRVAVAQDERTQELYGATGMPTLALVDRAGIVRYSHFGGGEDPRFNALLKQCLQEKIC